MFIWNIVQIGRSERFTIKKTAMSGVLEQQVWELREENKELKERLEVIEKNFEKMQKKDSHEFSEIINKMKDFNEKIASFLSWKEWIDKIIEKIKKILPIV